MCPVWLMFVIAIIILAGGFILWARKSPTFDKWCRSLSRTYDYDKTSDEIIGEIKEAKEAAKVKREESQEEIKRIQEEAKKVENI